MNLHPILNHIIFSFIDDVDNKGQFVKTTTWGLVIPGHHDASAKMPRWATVLAKGPDCKKDVAVGETVLIKPLKWTNHFTYDGVKMWRTDEDQIAVIKADAPIASDDNVIFKRIEDASQSKGGITIAPGALLETSRGTITGVGPKVKAADELTVGTTFYFSDQNFFNEFDFNGEKFWYISEIEILFYEQSE